MTLKPMDGVLNSPISLKPTFSYVLIARILKLATVNLNFSLLNFFLWHVSFQS